MVYIKRITIQGFKSFGPKRVIIKPEKGFVVITGPNGGGKSNVLDAIKFCLGELSNNALRVGKLSDLIHESNGRRLSQATVSLQLDNSERALPVENDEVTISRTILSNGESIYRVNGKTVTRNELLASLASANIRPGGFNIITQGSVLSIAEKSPEELRKIIDEVAGTSEYDRRRSEAVRELELAEKNVAIAKAGLSELKSRVKQLELESSRLVRRSLITRYLAQLKRQRFQEELEELERKLLHLEEEERALMERRSAAVKNVEALTAERHEVSAELREVEAELLRIQNRLNELRPKTLERGTSLESLRASIRSEGSRYISFRKGSSEVEAKIQAINAEATSLEKEYREAGQEYSQLSSRLSELGKRLAELNDRRGEALKTLTSWREELEELERNRLSMMREVSQLQGSIELVEQKAGNTAQRISELENELEKISGERGVVENELEEHRLRVETLNENLRRLGEERESLKQRIQSLEERRRRVKGMIEELTRIRAEIDGVLESLSPRSGEGEKSSKEAIGGHPPKLRDLLRGSEVQSLLLSAYLEGLGEALIVESDKTALALAELAASRGLDLSIVSLESSDSSPIHGKECVACRLGLKNPLLRQVLHSILPGYELLEDGDFRKGQPAISQSGVQFNGYGHFRALPKIGKKSRLEKMLSEVLQALETVSRIDGENDRELESLEVMLSRLEEKRVGYEAERREITAGASRLEARLLELEKAANRIKDELETLRRVLSGLTLTKERLLQELEAAKKKLEEAKPPDKDIGTHELEAEIAHLNSEINSLERAIGEESFRARGLAQRLEQIKARRRELDSSVERLKIEAERLRSDAEASGRRLRELARTYLEVWKRESESRVEAEALSRRSSQLLHTKNELVERLTLLEERLEATRSELLSLETQARSLAVARVELTMGRKSILDRLSSMSEQPIDDLSLLPKEVLENVGAELQKELASVEMVNQLAPVQYSELIVEFRGRSEGVATLESERKRILEIIESLDAKKLEVFMRTFRKVSEDFGKYFTALTGGNGWLEFSYPENPLESGVEMYVAFPGKSAMPSRSISGGEKSVSAVALLMAFQGLTPADFLIMDEVDAHMDANYSRNLAELLKESSKRSQVIAVSLKDVIAEKADQLIGVYNQEGESRVVVTRLEDNQA
ncbi:MAG: chromosome segregation SMC family protein [Nitrososphaerota archaeon]